MPTLSALINFILATSFHCYCCSIYHCSKFALPKARVANQFSQVSLDYYNFSRA